MDISVMQIIAITGGFGVLARESSARRVSATIVSITFWPKLFYLQQTSRCAERPRCPIAKPKKSNPPSG
jgi:hypothetical protein